MRPIAHLYRGAGLDGEATALEFEGGSLSYAALVRRVDALAAAVNAGRRTPVHIVPKLDDMAARVADLARPGDLVITLGAGSIGSLAGALVDELQRRHR